MSHHTHEHSADGGEEGFLDKVKDFFTGGDDERSRDDVAEGHADLSDAQDDLAEGQGETDSVASAGAGGGGSTESGWDGSDEPPELTVPGNEAVAAYSEASEDDGVAVSDDYESRHGNGVDDSGVLADAPLKEGNGSAMDTGGRAESVIESRAGTGSGTGTGTGTGSGSDVESGAVSTLDDPSVDRPTDSDPQPGTGEGTREPDADREQREGEDAATDEERRERGEEFAREHDPETHDVEAGEEFRQRGDWTADEHGGPQVQEADGTVHDPGTPEAEAAQEQSRQEESDGGEVRDGGHGWGSAAPLAGGAMPAGHPVKAWHDTMTFVLPDEDGYSADPHEWFVDEEAARRAGFRHAHGD